MNAAIETGSSGSCMVCAMTVAFQDVEYKVEGAQRAAVAHLTCLFVSQESEAWRLRAGR